jgi:hypothetical protein
MEKEQQKNVYMSVGGLMLMIGFGFLLWMISTMIEFGQELEVLKNQLQMYNPYFGGQAWDDPRVQEVIRQGYMTLFTDKAVFFIPLIITGLILIGVGKSKASAEIKEETVKATTDKIQTQQVNKAQV